METIEILHYKWCLLDSKELYSNDHIIIHEVGYSLIYCKVEKYTNMNQVGLPDYKNCGVRTVPVKREEMEKI